MPPTDIAPVYAAGYIEMLDELRPRFGAAVGAIADAPADRCVVVHCFAGKDRTGLVAALVLSLVGVPDELVAGDYEASDPGVETLSAPWFAAAADEDELALRRLICISPQETMLDVLGWLRENEGGAESYLGSAGVTKRQIAAVRARLT